MRMNQFVASIVTFALSASIAFAGGDTVLTYQGRLLDAGEPANGTFNLDFTLFDALSGGAQVGSTIVMNGTQVTDGLLTVELDFGASAFDNTGRWLEIAVNGSTLIPRQPITRSPYSIQTRGIFVDDNNNVGIGTLSPNGRLDVGGGHLVVTGYPNIDCCVANGAVCNNQDCYENVCEKDESCCGVDWHLACADLAATLCYICQSGNVGIGNTAPVNKLSVAGNADFSGNVGIGTTAPSARLHVVGNATITGELKTGSHHIKPAVAYGTVTGGGLLSSGSTNITSVTATAPITGGAYSIEIEGGFLVTDVVQATLENVGYITGRVSNGKVNVTTYRTTGNQGNRAFSFVIFRP